MPYVLKINIYLSIKLFLFGVLIQFFSSFLDWLLIVFRTYILIRASRPPPPRLYPATSWPPPLNIFADASDCFNFNDFYTSGREELSISRVCVCACVCVFGDPVRSDNRCQLAISVSSSAVICNGCSSSQLAEQLSVVTQAAVICIADRQSTQPFILTVYVCVCVWVGESR